MVIVEAVIGLSRAFDRLVVAEGTESAVHIVRLLELGCKVYLKDILTRLRTQPARRVSVFLPHRWQPQITD